MGNVYVGATTVATLLNAKRRYNPKSIISEALDGSVYIQTPARAITRYQIDAFCDTIENRNALDTASNEGALIKIDLIDETQASGYIEGAISWKEWKDGHGVGKFTMIVR